MSQPAQNLDQLMTLDQFAAWLGKSKRWAYLQAWKGRVPAVKIGKAYWFHKQTILEQCKTT